MGGYIFSLSTLVGGGYPVPDLGRGVPHLRSGGYPIQGLARGRGCGTPGRGTPWTWDGVPPRPGMGYPLQTWDGLPPWTWDGAPPCIVSTCSMAGSMPLAFTQEDFLVCWVFPMPIQKLPYLTNIWMQTFIKLNPNYGFNGLKFCIRGFCKVKISAINLIFYNVFFHHWRIQQSARHALPLAILLFILMQFWGKLA